MRLKPEFWYLCVVIILLAVTGQVLYTYKYLPAKQREVKLVYSHEGAPHRDIVDLIREADKFVYFAVYTFTRDDIKDALLEAKTRGLVVRGLTDGQQYNKVDKQKALVNELREAGIPIAFQDHLGIMHLKAVVTDKAYASGSYNWTGSASSINDEVLEISHDPEVRGQYEKLLLHLLELYPPPQN